MCYSQSIHNKAIDYGNKSFNDLADLKSPMNGNNNDIRKCQYQIKRKKYKDIQHTPYPRFGFKLNGAYPPSIL